MRMLIRCAAPALVLVLGLATLPAWTGPIAPLTTEDKQARHGGLQGLTHHKTRVHGMFVDARTVFYHQGESTAFQDYLDRLAALEDVALKEVRLEDGRGKAPPPKAGSTPLTIDWMLVISRDLLGQKEVGDDRPVLNLTLWLDSSVDLKKIRWPDGVRILIPASAA